MRLSAWTIVAACAAIGSVAGAQQEHPCVVYADSALPTRSATREWSGMSWSTESTQNALTDIIRWQRVCNSPGTTERSLLSLTSDARLTLATFNGTFWGAPATVCADTGSASTRVCDAAYEHNSGELMVVYRKTTSTSVYFRTYNTAIPLEQTLNLGLAAAPSWMELVMRPRSDEMMLMVAAGGRLYASVWNGSAWGSATTLESSLGTAGRPFAGAYMNNTGRGLVVWSATSGAPKYSVWSGTAWSAAASMPAVSGGAQLGWVTVAGSPAAGSNEVLFAGIGTNLDVNVNRWDGSNWGANTVVESNTGAANGRRVDIAYQPNGAKAVLAWHRSGSTPFYYRVWNGSSWSAEQAGPDMTSESQLIMLEAGYDVDQVVMGVRHRGPVSYEDYVAYSTGGSVNLTGEVHGLVGSGAGMALPPAPAAVEGVTNVVLGNNETRTLTPGNYAALETGNNCTLNLNTAGTYVFRYFKANFNTTHFNFDTSGGDIDFILTNGDFDGKNGTWFINNGTGKVRLHVNNGDFDSKNANLGENIAIFAYNGDISFGSSLVFAGEMYASGNISGSGVIDLSTNYIGNPGRLSVVTFTDGAPGARTELSNSVEGYWGWEVCGLAGRPPARNVRVSRWREIGPDE